MNHAEDDHAFICRDCDEKHAGFKHGEHHSATHNLVVCKETQERDDSDDSDNTQERLTALEHKMSELSSQMVRIERLLQSLAIPRTE